MPVRADGDVQEMWERVPSREVEAGDVCVWFLCDGHDDTADPDKRRLFFFILRALDRFPQTCFMAALSLMIFVSGARLLR